jgi:hypothetical protein
MPTTILMSRGEFIDALAALSRGNVIALLDDSSDACVLDGVRLMWSFPSLIAYGLIAEYPNPDGFGGVRYYRMTAEGRQFATKALAAWRARPLLERLAIRLIG